MASSNAFDFVEAGLAERLHAFEGRNFEELERCLLGTTCQGEQLPRRGLSSLREGIERFERVMQQGDPSFDFYRVLLPRVRAWGLSAVEDGSLPLCRSGQPSRIELSRQRVRGLLAAAFFLGTVQHGTTGSLAFHSVYSVPCSEAEERVLCLLAYFHQAEEAGDGPAITISRFRLDRADAPDWDTLKLPLAAARVRLHTGRMEESAAPVFFDFANRDLHIHRVIPSLTQEEVLFSMCPEAFAGIPCCERMRPDEVLVIDGVRRFAEYSGYLSTFRFTGFHSTRPTIAILAADAVMEQQFSEPHLRRDLDKAFLGFRAAGGRPVSTGHWGCGAFGGDRTLKFLQQVCAATAAGVDLDYSTFRDQETAAKLGALLALAERKGVTVADLMQIVRRFPQTSSRIPFQDHVAAELAQPWPARG